MELVFHIFLKSIYKCRYRNPGEPYGYHQKRSPVSSQSPAEFPVSWAALAQAYAEAKSGLVIIAEVCPRPCWAFNKNVRHHGGPHQEMDSLSMLELGTDALWQFSYSLRTSTDGPGIVRRFTCEITSEILLNVVIVHSKLM